MTKLKLLIGAAVAAMLVLIALVAVPMALRYDGLETNRELENLIYLNESGAEARGVSSAGEVILSGSNLSRVVTLLSFIERKHVIFPPKRTPGDAGAVVTVEGGTEISLVPAEPEGGRDKVLIYYKNGDKERCYSLTGYSTIETVTAAISPEGYYDENTPV